MKTLAESILSSTGCGLGLDKKDLRLMKIISDMIYSYFGDILKISEANNRVYVCKNEYPTWEKTWFNHNHTEFEFDMKGYTDKQTVSIELAVETLKKFISACERSRVICPEVTYMNKSDRRMLDYSGYIEFRCFRKDDAPGRKPYPVLKFDFRDNSQWGNITITNIFYKSK